MSDVALRDLQSFIAEITNPYTVPAISLRNGVPRELPADGMSEASEINGMRQMRAAMLAQMSDPPGGGPLPTQPPPQDPDAPPPPPPPTPPAPPAPPASNVRGAVSQARTTTLQGPHGQHATRTTHTTVTKR